MSLSAPMREDRFYFWYKEDLVAETLAAETFLDYLFFDPTEAWSLIDWFSFCLGAILKRPEREPRSSCPAMREGKLPELCSFWSWAYSGAPI